MKQKLLILILILIAGTQAIEVKAQSLVIKMKDGTEDIRQLSSLQNFTFSNSNLLLNYFSSSTESYSLSTIRSIYFNSIATGTENTTLNKGAGTLVIFPNPISNFINIQNLP